MPASILFATCQLATALLTSTYKISNSMGFLKNILVENKYDPINHTLTWAS